MIKSTAKTPKPPSLPLHLPIYWKQIHPNVAVVMYASPARTLLQCDPAQRPAVAWIPRESDAQRGGVILAPHMLCTPKERPTGNCPPFDLQSLRWRSGPSGRARLELPHYCVCF